MEERQDGPEGARARASGRPTDHPVEVGDPGTPEAEALNALLGAIRQCPPEETPERLWILWEGYGDSGAIEEIDWGEREPRPEGESGPLVDEPGPYAFTPPRHVTHAAAEFGGAWIEALSDLQNLEDNAGGSIRIAVDCATGDAFLSACSPEPRLQRPEDPDRLHFTLPKPPASGQWKDADLPEELSADAADVLWAFAESLAPGMREAVAEFGDVLGDVPAAGRFVALFTFSGQGDEGMFDDVSDDPVLLRERHDGKSLRRRWSWSSRAGKLLEKAAERCGVADVVQELADDSPHEWRNGIGGEVRVRVTLPLDPDAEGAELAVERETLYREEMDVEFLTHRMRPPGPSPKAAKAPAAASS